MSNEKTELQRYGAAQIARIEDAGEAILVKNMADAAQLFYQAQGDWDKAQQAKEISMRTALQAGLLYDRAPEQRGDGSGGPGGGAVLALSAGTATPKQTIIDQAEQAGIGGRTLQDWARYSRALDRLDAYIADRGAEHFREWTFADFARWAFMHIPESTGDEWYTPEEYIRSVRKVLGTIDLDPASSEQANRTIGAKQIFTKDDDGLEQEWHGRIFMNPPYSKNKPFAEKLVLERELGHVTQAIVLVGAHAIETQWFRPYWDQILCFTGHRIKFDTPDGQKIAGNINGSVFVYFGDRPEIFAEQFQQHGFVVVRWR